MHKILIFVIFASLISLSSHAVADYQQEIKALTDRTEELAGDETGLSDTERFNEMVAIAYDYTMLSFPEFATFLGDPRGQDSWTNNSEAAFEQRNLEQNKNG